MVNVGKREDGLLDHVLEYQHRLKSGQQQIELWRTAHPELAPILDDIADALKEQPIPHEP